MRDGRSRTPRPGERRRATRIRSTADPPSAWPYLNEESSKGVFLARDVLHGSGMLGKHTFRVRAINAVGNVDGTPATRTWKRV